MLVRNVLPAASIFLLFIAAGCDRNEDTNTSPSTSTPNPQISATPAAANWPRQALVIPELTTIPTLDGNFHPEVWEKAALAELKYPMDSATPSAAEARYRV